MYPKVQTDRLSKCPRFARISAEIPAESAQRGTLFPDQISWGGVEAVEMWAAELDITIRQIPDQIPDQVSEGTYCLAASRVAQDADSDVIVQALTEIVHDATGQYDGFVLQESKSLYEWGASHGAWSYFVEVIAGIDEVALGIAISKVFDRVAAVIGAQPPLDHETALNSAQWAVLRHNPALDRGSLDLVSREHERETNRWTFGFRPGDGWEYVAEVGWHGQLPGVVRVKRARVDGA